MRELAIALLMSVLFVSATRQAHSYCGYCTEPSPPSCVDDLDSYGATSSSYEFESCKDEIENYRREIEEFAECVKSELSDNISEFVSSYNDLVKKYNCKARREQFCF